jgi:hypothetical protein
MLSLLMYTYKHRNCFIVNALIFTPIGEVEESHDHTRNTHEFINEPGLGLTVEILLFGTIGFLLPVLPSEILRFPDIDPFWVGVFFGVPALFSIIMKIILSCCNNKINNLAIIFIGLFLYCVSLAFMSRLWMRDDENLIFIGMCLLGVVYPLLTIPVIQSMSPKHARFICFMTSPLIGCLATC